MWEAIKARAEYFNLLNQITGWKRHVFELLQHEQNNQSANPNGIE